MFWRSALFSCLISISAAASAQSPIQFDLGGLHIGATQVSATDTLRELGYSLNTQTLTHKRAGSKAIALRIIATKSSPTLPLASDQIVLWLSYAPDEGKVLGIYREVRYTAENAPLLRSFFEKAKEKAGFESYSRLPNVVAGYLEGEQLIRWRPDGGKPSGLGKLLFSLDTSGQTDPCVENYAGANSRFGGASMSRYFNLTFFSEVEFYNHELLEGTAPTNAAQAFFVPRVSCGTTYIARILQDRNGGTQVARMLLLDQTSMFKNAVAHRKWVREQNEGYLQEKRAAAATPDI